MDIDGMGKALAALLRRQDGVVSRRQVLALDLQPHDLRRMVRRRELVRMHPGVYVDHTGEPTWQQQAWAAVLYAEPAALCGESALRAGDGPGRATRDESGPIHVAVDRKRAGLVEPEGVRIHRLAHDEDRYLWNLGPPRLRYEEAALDVAASAGSELDAIAALASACGSRRTTARRLLASLAARPRVPRRDWLSGVLHDVAEGTCSVLEHGYLDRVERPHGLPAAQRQVRATASSGLVFRDAEYDATLVVELDGRLFHDSTTQRDADFERDLDAAVDGRTTVRLAYGQVFGRPCRTADRLGRVLEAHDVTTRPHGCSAGCPVAGPRAA